MDEMTLVREFCREVEDPDEDTTLRARAALTATISEAVRRPARRPRRGRRGWVAMFGVAAVVTASVVGVVSVLPGSDTGAPAGAAAAVLGRWASTAAHQPPIAALRPGQYIYTKSRSLNTSDWYDVGANGKQSFSVDLPQVRQTWISHNGSGRVVERTGRAVFPSRHDRHVWIATGRPPLGGNQTSTFRLGRGGLTVAQLDQLPTDPAKLRRLIEQRRIEGGPPGDTETFTIIGDLLRETAAPPKLRAALFHVAAQLPIVQVFGTTKWTTRPGIAVGYTYKGDRHELAFDPKTSALLGERTVDAGSGRVTSWTLYVATGVVNSLSETTNTAP